MDFLTTLFSHLEKTEKERQPLCKGSSQLGVCYQPLPRSVQRRDVATWCLLSLSKAHVFTWERHQFNSWCVILWRSHHAKGI